MTPKKVVICEDHEIVVDGIEMLLANSLQYTIVGHARKETDLQQLIAEKNPDIVLLDLNLGKEDGFHILQSIRKKNANIKVIIFTMYDNQFLIEKARLLKANGYLLKDTINGELKEALAGVYQQEFFLHESLLKRRTEHDLTRDTFVERKQLPKRETEIICLVAKGKQNEEIAELLFLSLHTVKTHRKNILKKLNITNTADLVRFAFENHLLEP